MQDYVEQREGAYWVAGTRVSLDSIVYGFREGQSPESLVQVFPAVTLEQVYGAVTFYLGHQAKIDAYLQEGARDYEATRQADRRADPAFYERLATARKRVSHP